MAAFASTTLPRCLRLAFFEHYQYKVLTDVKKSAFNQLNHSLMDSCMCSVTSMFSKIHCIHLGIEEEPKLFEVHLCDYHSSK